MKSIKYRALRNEGEDIFVTVQAKSINEGFVLAVAQVFQAQGELHSIEFWAVV